MDGKSILARGRIARGLSLEIFLEHIGDETRLRCVWTPDVPRELRGSALRRYRQLRDVAMTRVAESVGGRVVVVELGS